MAALGLKPEFCGLCATSSEIDCDISIQASCFDGFHGDPADRLIAATALQNTAELVTADERLLSCELAITRLDARI